MESTLKLETGEIGEVERQVLEALRNNEIISLGLDNSEKKTTFGNRVSDKIASFGGSWKFIIGFLFVLFIWLIINSGILLARPFDPYPFIFLNLVLSCVAALQAPIIMMSQNRQAAKDRIRAESDYKTNLKAELEIRHLHIKLDQLLTHQWHKLLEIQQLQLDIMNEGKIEDVGKSTS